MTGAGWTGSAREYADTFARLCEGAVPDLLQMLGAGAGDLVLDVGAGTGTASAALARSGSRVVGMDPDPEMARATARTGVPVTRAALPRLPLGDAAVDHSLANFVVNHLADPRAGVGEIARVTRHRVVASIWPGRAGDRARLLAETFERAGVTIPAGERLPPALDFARDATGLAALLTEAGLREVETREPTWTWSVGADRLWRGVVAGIGVHGRVFRAQPDDGRAALAAAYAGLVRGRAELRLRETAVIAAGIAG